MRADAFSQEPISNLPGEHGGVVLLVLGDGVHHHGRRHFGLGAADDARLEVAGFVEPEHKIEFIMVRIGAISKIWLLTFYACMAFIPLTNF